VFLADNPQKPVHVTVGMYNIKFIEIPAGLKDGDRVLLSPPFDAEEKDLAGSIITNGEDVVAAGMTNHNLGPSPMSEARSFSANGRRARPGESDADGQGTAPRSRRTPNGEFTPPNMSQLRRGPDSAESDPSSGPSRESRRGSGPQRQFTEGGPRQGADGTQPRMNREELMKQFDTNGDGELDETERAAMRERVGGRRRAPGSTNSPAEPSPAPLTPNLPSPSRNDSR
jgi:hypothetical protein